MGSWNGPATGFDMGGISGNWLQTGVQDMHGRYDVREMTGSLLRLYGVLGSAAIALCGRYGSNISYGEMIVMPAAKKAVAKNSA